MEGSYRLVGHDVDGQRHKPCSIDYCCRLKMETDEKEKGLKVGLKPSALAFVLETLRCIANSNAACQASLLTPVP